MNELQRWGMFSRDQSKLFTVGRGTFGWSITKYKLVGQEDGKDNYESTGHSIHKDYEDVFDEMMSLLSVDNLSKKP